jgi:hypothetical protein
MGVDERTGSFCLLAEELPIETGFSRSPDFVTLAIDVYR